MINLEITVSPAAGKKIELIQSIVYFQESLKKNILEFEVIIEDEEDYRISFKLESEEEAKKLMESSGFTLLSGAIQTLCNQHSLTLNDKENNINLLNCKNFAKIKNYLIIKEKENA
jgi:hypothetical protein